MFPVLGLVLVFAHGPGEDAIADRRCGVNAVVLAARLCGTTITFEQAETQLADAGTLIDLASIQGVLAKHGLYCKGVRLSPQELPNLPAIIAIRRAPRLPRHYVVLYGVAEQKVQVIDYPLPPTWVGHDQLTKVWDGAALLVSSDARQLERHSFAGMYGFGVVLASVGFVLLVIARSKQFNRPRTQQARLGLTLIEILVTIGIIGLLLAFSLPAMQRAREAASRVQCANNLKQLGTALHSYQSIHTFFPPSYGSVVLFGQDVSLRDYSMHSQILPFIEYKDAFNSINFHVEAWSAQNRTASTMRVNVFLCPSDGFEFHTPYAALNSYRANHGTGPYPTKASASPESGDGAFRASRSCISPSEFTDGLEHTAAMSEKRRGDENEFRFTPETDGFLLPGGATPSREALRSLCESTSAAVVPHYSDAGFTWLLAGPRNTWYNHIEAPNATLPDCALRVTHPETGIFTARSQHPGGVNVLFASGTVRFISQTVDLAVWRGLGSRNGHETIDSSSF